jgi:hypothetical protein
LDVFKLHPNQFRIQISNTLQKHEGGEGTNLGKGIMKHKGTMKQQGAKRYLGGQENDEAQRSDNTPRSNEVVMIAKHEQQLNTSSNETQSSPKTRTPTKHNEQ